MAIRIDVSRVWAMAVATVLAVGLAGCEAGTWPSVPPTWLAPPSPTIQGPADVKYYPSDEPLRLAMEHFNHGDYGLAQRYFRDAVEKAPRDATAWIGLAASYDRIGRFDLADRAYAMAIGLVGETTENSQ